MRSSGKITTSESTEQYYSLTPFFFTPGGSRSAHQCFIPHLDTPMNGVQNSVSTTIGGVIVPGNFYHYIHPDYHKEYARWMPPYSIVKHILTGSYTEEDCLLNKDNNGFVSYVMKKGINPDGIYGGAMSWTSPKTVSDSRFHGKLVTTNGSDANTSQYKLALVQRPEYAEMCRELVNRFIMLAALSECESRDELNNFINEHFTSGEFNAAVASFEHLGKKELKVVFRAPDLLVQAQIEDYRHQLTNGTYQSPEFPNRTQRGEGTRYTKERNGIQEEGYYSSDDEEGRMAAQNSGRCSIM